MGLFDTSRTVAEAFPPGEFIKDELAARGWTQADLAEILGRNTGTVSQIISGKQPLNPRLAHELGAAFGTDAQSWMNLQTSYQLWKEQQDTDTESVRRRAALFERAPVKEMIKRRWIEPSESVDVLEEQVFRFLGVSSTSEQPSLAFAARQTSSYSEPPSAAVTVWIMRARQLANIISAPKYSKAKLTSMLPSLRRLMEDADGVREVPRILTSAGIRIVAIEKLPSMAIDAVTFWLPDDRPVIALSVRHDRLDWFWHTLLHEIDHVLHGEGRENPCIDVLDENAESAKPPNELRCDDFAAKFSIERTALDSFVARVKPYFTAEKARGFALRMRVHPAIAAGQIRNRTRNYSILSPLVSTKVRPLMLGTFLCDGWGQEPQISA